MAITAMPPDSKKNHNFLYFFYLYLIMLPRKYLSCFLLYLLCIKINLLSANMIAKVTVQTPSDGDGSPYDCELPTGTTCSIRLAWQYCKLIVQKSSTCVINIPSGNYIFNAALGDLNITEIDLGSKNDFNIVINGEGYENTRIFSFTSENLNSRFVRVDLRSAIPPSLSISINGIYLTYFGNGNANNIDSGGCFYFAGNVSATLAGVKIFNTVAMNGGALYADSVSRLTVQMSNFTAVYAFKRGGSFYLKDCENVNIIDSYFYTGAAVNYGGAVYVNTSSFVNFDNVVFNRVALYRSPDCLDCGGNAIYIDQSNSYFNFINCAFLGTGGGNSGGAIALNEGNQHILIQNSRFTENGANLGPALYANQFNSDVTFLNCSMTGNQAGAVFLQNYNYHFKFVNVVFLANFNSGRGGAVYLGTNNFNISFSYCLFKDNLAKFTDGSQGALGGAIYGNQNNSYVVISYTQFINNAANTPPSSSASAAGAIYFRTDNNYLTLFRCSFVNNYAQNGGAIYLDLFNDPTTISHCVFDRNRGERGGAIMFNDGHNYFVLASTNFTENRANQGGAIYIFQSNQINDFADCIFMGNVARDLGGAVYILTLTAYMRFRMSNFTANSAMYGSAVYLSQGNTAITFNKCMFYKNTGTSGAALYVNILNQDIAIENSTFMDNTALAEGGAVMFATNNIGISVINSLFEGNTARGVGGGMILQTDNIVTAFQGCRFVRNNALQGGAIYFYSDNVVGGDGIVNSVFDGNQAGHNGGAICLETSNTVAVSKCTFLNNVAVGSRTESGGGAVAVMDTNTYSMYDSVAYNNTAVSGNGGALILGTNNVEVNISACKFEYNRAVGYSGGAVAVSDGYNDGVSITGNLFSENVAATGGGLWLSGSAYGIVMNNSFHQNTAHSVGAGVAVQGGILLYLSNNVFRSNHATSFGGAVSVTSARNLTLKYSQLRTNLATYGSAVYAAQSAGMTIAGNTFERNVATRAGTVYWESEGMSEPVGLSVGGLEKHSQTRTRVDGILDGGQYQRAEVGLFHLIEDRYGGRVGDGPFQVLYADSVALRIVHSLAQDASSGIATNIWTANVAPYGVKYATEVVSLESTRQNVSGYRAGSTLPNLNVYARDYYSQLVSTLPSSYVSASTGAVRCDLLGYLNGGRVVQTSNGSASFNELKVYCDPNGYLDVLFQLPVTSTLSASAVSSSYASTTVKVHFRHCLRGEKYNGGLCVPCPNGTFSLAPNSDGSVLECKSCPKEAGSCYGSVVSLESGYWRSARFAESIFDCPGGSAACIGGTVTGKSLCAVGYKGPLCAVCSSGYFSGTLTYSCTKCGQGKYSIVAVILIVLIILLGLYLFWRTLDLGGEMLHLDLKEVVGIAGGGTLSVAKETMVVPPVSVKYPTGAVTHRPSFSNAVALPAEKPEPFEVDKAAGKEGESSPPIYTGDFVEEDYAVAAAQKRRFGTQVAGGVQILLILKVIAGSILRVVWQVRSGIRPWALGKNNSVIAP